MTQHPAPSSDDDAHRASIEHNSDEAAPVPAAPALSWVPFVLPLFVYMLLGSIKVGGISYPIAYALQVGLTLAVASVALPTYRSFRFRITRLSLLVGIVGGVVWIGACRLNVEAQLRDVPVLGSLIGTGDRAGFNPFFDLSGQPVALVMFLAVRFFGLLLLVPLIEEFFLRGFLMRFVIDANWPTIAFGAATTVSIIAGTVYGVVAHPAELLAAAVWFSLITWLMIRTRNIWDCVAAHALTNLVLGLYVVVWQDWRLW